MSNTLAIATVTQALQAALSNAVAQHVGGALVTTLPPDDPSFQGPPQQPTVNVFLYQVTPNAAWRNADLSARRADGTVMRRPQAAVDLHYLLSFYGAASTLDTQRLLGVVLSQLHTFPVLSRDRIAAVQTGFLSNSDLADQADLVRFTPISFSLEEMSKLWSVCLKTDYALSVAYTASVVLIESDDVRPAPALPVLKRFVQAVRFSLSSIDSVTPQSVVPAPPAPMSIKLRGRGMGIDDRVAFVTPGNSTAIVARVGSGASNDVVPVTLPAGLRPGVNSVQLMQTIASPPGAPPTSPVVSKSNIMTFLILPAIVRLSPALAPGLLLAVVFPAVAPSQQVSLILNQPGGPLAISLPADPHPAETDTFTFNTVLPSTVLPPGAYLARIQVDSAESRFTVDSSGKFNGPMVNI